MVDLKKHTNTALGYFLIVALMGVLLRLFYATPIPMNYRYWLHAHSHTALLGWIYIGLTTLIYKLFLSSAKKGKLYKRIFLFTNLCIVGMLVTFPIQGYALFSIIFSTLFLVASYAFAWFAMRHVPKQFKKRFSWKLIKTSLWYLVFSSIGPWAVGGVMATLGKASIWYKIAIYFYLHFQYNAWFVLALLGLLFFIIERKKLQVDTKQYSTFFWVFNSGLILSFFLSVLYVEPPVFVYILGGIGAVLQAIAFYLLFKILKPIWKDLGLRLNSTVGVLLKVAGVFLIIKALLQLLGTLPYFAELAFAHPDLIIVYLHMVFLGIVSISLFAFLIHFKLLRLSVWGLVLFGIAFVATESLILYKGFVSWLDFPFFADFFWILVGASVLFPVAIGILFFGNLKFPWKRTKL